MQVCLTPNEGRQFTTQLGIDLSAWCKEQGLVQNRDYDWAFRQGELHFRFHCDSESYATLFTLRWAEYL